MQELKEVSDQSCDAKVLGSVEGEVFEGNSIFCQDTPQFVGMCLMILSCAGARADF